MASIELFPVRPTPPTPPAPTKEQLIRRATSLARMQTVGIAGGLKSTYDSLRTLVYASSDYTAEEFYTAIGEPAASQLKQFAVLAKSILNAAAPNTIQDDVPEATITMPGGE